MPKDSLGERVNVEPSLSGSGTGPSTRYPFTRDRLFLTCGLAAALLFWGAAAENADGFYTFLRIYTCGLSLVWALVFHNIERPAWALAALCVAILFNPIFPIELPRETWQVIDVASACFYAWLSLQRYALTTGKRWVPFVPTAAVGAILVFAVVGVRTTNEADNNMAVENLEAGNLIVENPYAQNEAATDPYSDLPNAVNSIDLNDVRPLNLPATTYAQPQTYDVPTNSTSVADPGISQRWLDNVLGKDPKSGAEAAPGTDQQVNSVAEPVSNLDEADTNDL